MRFARLLYTPAARENRRTQMPELQPDLSRNAALQAKLVFPGFALLAVLYYSIPLFSGQTSIHWDLADISYPVQKYFADSVRAGTLPHWTAFLFSGMPFLSDPAVG